MIPFEWPRRPLTGPFHASDRHVRPLPVHRLWLALFTAPLPADDPTRAEEMKVRTVAVLLFEWVELMEFAGPAEVFVVAHHGKAFKMVTVAESTKPLKTMGGVTVTPDFDYAIAPKADMLVVPGGNTQAVGKQRRGWVKKASGDAEITLSVCFGAMLLADAGWLDGVEATTHRWGLDGLKEAAPKCKVVEGKRFVDAGKVITTTCTGSG